MEHKCVIDDKFVFRLCQGKPDAILFFWQWYKWIHAIDDLVDELATAPGPAAGEFVQRLPTAKDRELIVATFAQAVIVLGHPFYLANMQALRLVAVLIASRYADTVRWEKDEALPGSDWRKVWADHHRGVGQEMAVAIALICGGWDHARSVSAELVELCYYSHHDEQGNQK